MLSHRQIRRKYGIPDDDNDVFNVAYARAVRRKQEEEKKQRELQKSAQVAASAPVASSSREPVQPAKGETFVNCELENIRLIFVLVASTHTGVEGGFSSGVLRNSLQKRLVFLCSQ